MSSWCIMSLLCSPVLLVHHWSSQWHEYFRQSIIQAEFSRSTGFHRGVISYWVDFGLAGKFTWWSSMLSNVSCVHLCLSFFFFLFSSSAIDVCLLSSVTTRVNLSLQSLLDQLRWWLTLCRSADVSSLGSPFLVQTDPHYWLALRCTVNINNLTLLSLVIVNTILLLVLPTTPLS